ncbi:uncharacterized protein LOC127793528 [Diospyros lotus]|uniref:uncharacterized protein LOC127793528 n=1 Tax=Diospyros lotus TaxID=55363 RepID=UPI002253EA11|nr:uncharacterized protein LOC127793528 [Diospyros lotus]
MWCDHCLNVCRLKRENSFICCSTCGKILHQIVGRFKSARKGSKRSQNTTSFQVFDVYTPPPLYTSSQDQCTIECGFDEALQNPNPVRDEQPELSSKDGRINKSQNGAHK